MRDRARYQQGTTFIEVIAAVSVFALVVTGLSPALLSARKAAALSKNQSIATTLAKDKIEDIRSRGTTACTSDANLQADGSSGGIFNRTCTQGANNPISGVNRVAVTVQWRDRPATSSVTLVTLVRQ
jgi:Tfp pilus assembly protein PilV